MLVIYQESGITYFSENHNTLRFKKCLHGYHVTQYTVFYLVKELSGKYRKPATTN